MSQQDESEANNKPAGGAPRLGRRLTVLKLAVVPAAAALAACVPAGGPVYRGGITDNDPVDPAGGGRGGYRGTGITDSDPSDPAGGGRGGFRRTGITDSDPSDPAGGGRGGRRYTGITDRDPSDSPGYGRGWR
ncbi:MAG: hypothetical protein N2Z67_02960 [Acetobacteraceae bacterium]|nr:hypothetical protein [Acetobacteraceae bacterium]MDW8399149.1 hypothetical protein [Acetobacteraceae bacterium]